MELEQAAALVALLRAKSRSRSWPEIATEVFFRGDAIAVWEEEAAAAGVLIPDPVDDACLAEATQSVQKWTSEGLRLVTVLDGQYPRRLLDIRETPPFLFYIGELTPNDRGMSVVGSRKVTDRGLRVAECAAHCLVERGLSVISGLAAGVDTAAHRTALKAGGRTVAFIGTGITKHYPAANRALQDEIGRRGVVFSQFWPDAPPTKQSFPMRNAVMSGYGLATIVVEAGEHSGTRIQARVALEHGRPVILTDSVVGSTTWGQEMVGRPGVHVVRGPGELEAAIEAVIAQQDSLETALSNLASRAA